MNPIEINTTEIFKLCKNYKVKNLYVFGSVLTDKFNSESDIDFVVDFQNLNVLDYADNYFDLKFALEKILNRPIDLLEEKAIKNPYLLQSINQKKKLIYGD